MSKLNNVSHESLNSIQGLADYIFNYQLNIQTVLNSENAIKTICDALDTLQAKSKGYVLLSITNNINTQLHLILCIRSGEYYIHTWKIKESIEKELAATVHASGDDDLQLILDEGTNNTLLLYDDILSSLIVESLTGYAVSLKKAELLLSFVTKKDTVQLFAPYTDPLILRLEPIVKKIRNRYKNKIKEYTSIISDFAKNLQCKDLSLNISTTDNKNIIIGEITKVIQINNTRFFELSLLDINEDKTCQKILKIHRMEALGNSHETFTDQENNVLIAEIGCYDHSYIYERLINIPFNFIDEGRVIIAIHKKDSGYKAIYDIILGADPKVCEDPIKLLNNTLENYIDTNSQLRIDLEKTKIKNASHVLEYENFEESVLREDTQNTKPIQIKLKTLKKMVDEYQYLIQKQISTGNDINISDKVVYNNSLGKVSYNDFSIEINDELIKSRLAEEFNKVLVDYYRGDISEEKIINNVLDIIINELNRRLNSYSKVRTSINITLNNIIKLELLINTSANGSRLIYINNQRFNKNEVVIIIKEILCSKSQKEVDNFISNIGKLGLAVYIGITSGYHVELNDTPKLFRFKKLKGRSNYTLVLDTIEIPIKGKELINLLYSHYLTCFIPYFERKVNNAIFKCTNSILDYAKYKFLIDSTYISFKERSLEFLKKKVVDINGEFCKYLNTSTKTLMDSIILTGLSGHKYLIAYDNSNSFVFMDPTLNNNSSYYENGKYICMIDKSNIKSNIGYDSVISKLLALKNDSTISGTIYNLKEELND